MEILKLRDEPLENELVQTPKDNKLKITDLKQGVKNPNRVNVFINSHFAFSLDVAQVVDLKLKVGKDVSVEELAEYKKASEFGKMYQRTLEWVLMRPRSVREVRDYLFRRLKMSSSGRSLCSSSDDASEFSAKIIEKLTLKGYIDDRKFAEFWVENRFVKKGVSRKRLSMELAKKGIARDIIDEVLSSRNDEDEIRKIIMRKRNKYDNEKLIAYLCRQGFSYDLVRKMVDMEEF